jgi:hypothetical protein
MKAGEKGSAVRKEAAADMMGVRIMRRRRKKCDALAGDAKDGV